MNKYIYLLITLIMLFKCINSLAQESEKTTLNIHAIGDTLDKEERDFYKLFSNVKDFQCAFFYFGEGNGLVAKVCYLILGKVECRTYSNYMAGIQNLNRYIENKDELSASTPGGKEITIYKADSTIVTGELISVRRNSILIFPAQGGINLIDDSDLISVLNKSDIVKVEIPNDRNFLDNCAFSYLTGFLFGALLGGLIALPIDEDYYIVTVPIGALIGGLVTYFIFSNDYDEHELTLDFNLIEQRAYSRFKSFEPMYLRNIK